MRNRKIPISLFIAGLIVLISASALMLRAGAQNRSALQPASQVATLVPEPTRAPQPTATPAVAPPTAAGAQNGLAQTNVESFSGKATGWTALSPNSLADQQGGWQISAGKLQAMAPTSESFDDSIYLAPVDTAGHAKVSTQFYPEGNQTVGLAFRATDQGYYLFRVFRAGDNGKALNTLQRYDAKSGTYTELAKVEQGQGYALNAWQTLQVEVNGDLIICTFEGQKVFEVHDKTFGSGKAGVYALAQGDVQFDNFTLMKP